LDIRKTEPLEIIEIEVGQLLVVSNSTERITWRTSCRGRAENVTTTANGTSRLVVPEGCTVYGADSAYTYLPRSVEATTELVVVIQHELELPDSLAEAFVSWGEVNDLLDEKFVTGYISATRVADLKTQVDLHQLHSVARTDSAYTLWAGIVVGIVLAIAVGTALVLWVKMRGRLTRLKTRHTESSAKWERGSKDVEDAITVFDGRAEEIARRAKDDLNRKAAELMAELMSNMEDRFAKEEERMDRRLNEEAAKLEVRRSRDMRVLTERVKAIQTQARPADRGQSRSRLSLLDGSLSRSEDRAEEPK
jgi:hypothetical protein